MLARKYQFCTAYNNASARKLRYFRCRVNAHVLNVLRCLLRHRLILGFTNVIENRVHYVEVFPRYYRGRRFTTVLSLIRNKGKSRSLTYSMLLGYISFSRNLFSPLIILNSGQGIISSTEAYHAGIGGFLFGIVSLR